MPTVFDEDIGFVSAPDVNSAPDIVQEFSEVASGDTSPAQWVLNQAETKCQGHWSHPTVTEDEDTGPWTTPRPKKLQLVGAGLQRYIRQSIDQLEQGDYNTLITYGPVKPSVCISTYERHWYAYCHEGPDKLDIRHGDHFKHYTGGGSLSQQTINWAKSLPNFPDPKSKTPTEF
ncbi:hypothetical protein M231_05699 [Tremella mesenterica]|uniref:Uncharacterized protein n=1 Tax=Tremella mesenterica TaxID=5217 RepID=A0A4Q1BHH1_TREME|nr:hypothetical protein M231_05699 [Tremella mesenterica]